MNRGIQIGSADVTRGARAKKLGKHRMEDLSLSKPPNRPAEARASVHKILDTVTSRIPRTVSGTDRLRLAATSLGELGEVQVGLLRQTIDGMVAPMAEMGASDLDLGGAGCNGRVWYRIYGRKRPDESNGSFTEDETDVLLLSLLVKGQVDHLFEARNVDFSYTISDGCNSHRYRGDLYLDLDHLALNMRHIPNRIRPFKDLELHPNAVRAMMLTYDRQGLTLVTGITGSGKSSTLDSIVDANNQTAPAHIVIIGSPIETVHQPKQSIVRHREVGRDVLSFKDGAVQALRQDPDIIVIGEMRDAETIMTALEVTDSGHKVFSTLHTASAVESIDRIIAECPPIEQNRVRERLADVLKCIVSQKLVPSLDGKRVMTKEVLVMNPSVSAAIKNDNTGEIYQMMREGSVLGMNTLEQDLKRLVNRRLVSPKEAIGYANNKRRMEELL